MSTSKVRRPPGAPTADPKPYHHGDLREALVAAALAMLEEGVEPAALSLREAARRAGVSAMAPYRHFADKEALLAAVAAVGFARLAAQCRRADATASGRDAVIAQGIAYVAFARASPTLFRLMFGAAVAKPPETEAAGDSAFAVLSSRVASIVGAGDASDLTLQCWALAHGLASLAIEGHLGRDASASAIAARVLTLVNLPEAR